MSILSRQWRYIWTTMTALVLNYQFSKRFAKEGASGRNEFIRIVNHIIIRRNGPIRKFSLHIPEEIDSFQEVDQWIMFFSRNIVRELIFTNSDQPYELLNDVFSCSRLTRLHLENCIFMPPPHFEGFPNLYDLSLENVDFRANSCGTTVSLPRLRWLTLFKCRYDFDFNIKARNLELLVVTACFDAILLRLMDSTPRLSMVVIYFWKAIEDCVQLEGMNLTRMLSILPKLRFLTMDGHFLKVPKWLPGAINSLSYLWLVDFQLSDLDQLHGALCLLRNSRNLENLRMDSTKHAVMHYDVGPASDHLESPDCLDQTLNQLRDVEITTLKGSRPELLFIKLLLAHSPSLDKMTIQSSGTIDASKTLNIVKDVMQFPRASPKAEIIYS
ncbi:hypothetical protein OSB04_013398 [Centaurea solstitialis]|uniref:FBD domain-containing protein n=1 Tax=Centaurea solstitialis TaxID=347529 RepID=A0AA38WQL1_9ASTR|nr:hypothetical protein OSB04_013398 [Centaurea solstitialis]